MNKILSYVASYYDAISQQILVSRRYTLLYFFVILYTVPYHRCSGLGYGHKIWMQSTNLGNADGWYDGKIPCWGQKIKLPEHEVVYLPSTLRIGPLIPLPHNGMILLPSNGKYSVI